MYQITGLSVIQTSKKGLYESHVILALHAVLEGYGSTSPGAVHDILIHVGDFSDIGLSTMNSFLTGGIIWEVEGRGVVVRG